MTAEQYFFQIGECKDEIKRCESELKEIREKCLSTPCMDYGGTSSEVGFKGSAVEKRVLKWLEKEKALYDKINRCEDKIDEIHNVIANIPDRKLRSLLYFRYEDGFTFERIAEEMAYSERHTRRLHDIALNKIEKFL